MKHLFVISLIISTTIMYGQNTNTSAPKPKNDKFLIGVNYSADIGYRKLNSTNSEQLNSLIIDNRNSSEQPRFGFTTGLNIKYKLSHHFGLVLGVQYSNKGYSSTTDFKQGGNYTFLAHPISRKIDNNYHYFDIPIRMVYKLGKKKVQFLTSIGITTNILIKATQTYILEYNDGHTASGSINSRYDFNKFNLSPTVSAGISYQISDKLQLNIEPTFRYGLLKTTNSPITESLWNRGLNIACYYTL